MTRILQLGILFLSISTAQAQPGQTDETAKAEIAKLDFILGNWEGTGWIYA